jgi:hypothetical protein
MIVTVATNVTAEPGAPSMPSRLFQKPSNSSVPNVHSETPKNSVPPRMPSNGRAESW